MMLIMASVLENKSRHAYPSDMQRDDIICYLKEPDPSVCSSLHFDIAQIRNRKDATGNLITFYLSYFHIS